MNLRLKKISQLAVSIAAANTPSPHSMKCCGVRLMPFKSSFAAARRRDAISCMTVWKVPSSGALWGKALWLTCRRSRLMVPAPMDFCSSPRVAVAVRECCLMSSVVSAGASECCDDSVCCAEFLCCAEAHW